MQETYKITLADLVKTATEKPELVTVIINGEYYEIETKAHA
jgi:hypothetical protein